MVLLVPPYNEYIMTIIMVLNIAHNDLFVYTQYAVTIDLTALNKYVDLDMRSVMIRFYNNIINMMT